MSYYVGVDAGQSNDYTAVAVVRKVVFRDSEGKRDSSSTSSTSRGSGANPTPR
jgi:hypothetical protein